MESALLGEPDARQHANNLRLLAALPRGAGIERRERIVDYEIVELAALLREGNPQRLTAEQVLVEYWSRITRFNGPQETYGDNGKYNAFVRLEDFSTLLEQARLADQWLTTPDDQRGPAPPLCGIPFGIKDSFAIQGLESKNGTQAFSGNLALRDATCVARLRAQGALIIGHTICSELSTHTVGQFAGNAWDPIRTPGGSSQGSGVDCTAVRRSTGRRDGRLDYHSCGCEWRQRNKTIAGIGIWRRRNAPAKRLGRGRPHGPFDPRCVADCP
ncbi:Amidase [Pseudomonas syringae pv. aptata]|uniref:Amidase n=1 Tax=Pseudomonas syringae pv. aptata TaxID=83167 RepID=A0A3M5WEH9_PSEAP|nr:Amidase [Pseudomonas syringae pv. aptata]